MFIKFIILSLLLIYTDNVDLTNKLNRMIERFSESDKELKKNGYKTIEDVFKITQNLYYDLYKNEEPRIIKLSGVKTLETFDYCRYNPKIQRIFDDGIKDECIGEELKIKKKEYEDFYGERLSKLKNKEFHNIIVIFNSKHNKLRIRSKLEVFIDSKTGEVLLFSKVDTMMSD